MSKPTTTRRIECKSQADVEAALLREDPALAWVIQSNTFGIVWLAGYPAERNIPGDEIQKMIEWKLGYWMGGAWRDWSPASRARAARAEAREWEAADEAMGVSDGGKPLTRRDLGRWITARTKAADKALARARAKAARRAK